MTSAPFEWIYSSGLFTAPYRRSLPVDATAIYIALLGCTPFRPQGHDLPDARAVWPIEPACGAPNFSNGVRDSRSAVFEHRSTGARDGGRRIITRA